MLGGEFAFGISIRETPSGLDLGSAIPSILHTKLFKKGYL